MWLKHAQHNIQESANEALLKPIIKGKIKRKIHGLHAVMLSDAELDKYADLVLNNICSKHGSLYKFRINHWNPNWLPAIDALVDDSMSGIISASNIVPSLLHL